MVEPQKTDKPVAPLPVRTARKFTCTHCGGQIEVRAGGVSLSAVCAHCGSIIDVADERLQIIQQTDTKLRRTLLEIGARGKLFGTQWEVIGYTQKSDRTKQYFWDEYLLFNPYNGFRFLIQQDGHWNFAAVVKDVVGKKGFVEQFPFRGENFKPYLRDNPIVQYVKGEFYWRIKKGDQAKTEDYIAPPYMVSFEYADGDISLTLCEYLTPGEVKSAFGIFGMMPSRSGVAPNQPGPEGLTAAVRCMALAILLLMAMYISISGASAKQLVAHANGVLQPADRVRVFMTDAIDVPKQSNMMVTSSAPVDNAWAEAEISLVNDDTKEEIELRQPIEYYHGYDSDGAWSEGSTVQENYFSAVPSGHYHLMYGVDSDVLQKGQPLPFDMVVKRDMPNGGNLFVALLLIIIYPLMLAFRIQSFETKRWENSDFPRSSN